MPKPALNQSAREKSVANMLATLRIENLSPSESLKASLQANISMQAKLVQRVGAVKKNSPSY